MGDHRPGDEERAQQEEVQENRRKKKDRKGDRQLPRSFFYGFCREYCVDRVGQRCTFFALLKREDENEPSGRHCTSKNTLNRPFPVSKMKKTGFLAKKSYIYIDADTIFQDRDVSEAL